MHKNLDKGLLAIFINLVGKSDVLLSDNNMSSHSISPSLVGERKNELLVFPVR